MLAVQSPHAKIFPFAPGPNQLYIPCRLVPQRGGSRSSRTRGGMRWTRAALLTRALTGGRRSRVVLTPRRRRQVGGSFSADDGDKKARSPGRARRKPLKPLRGECRTTRRDRGDYTRVLPTHGTRGCGRTGRPAFPAPSVFREREIQSKTRAYRRRDREAVAA